MIVPHAISDMLRRVRARVAATGLPAAPVPEPAVAVSLRRSARVDEAAMDSARRALGLPPEMEAAIAPPPGLAAACAANIENMIGAVSVPVGLAGPLRINGLHAAGHYPIPLATTEAALVASYARGARAVNAAGGATAALTGEGLIRSPAFVFDGLVQAGRFAAAMVDGAGALRAAAEATTAHGRLLSLEPVIDANVVFLLCRFSTGDASGQNMVTIAAEALCRAALELSPVAPRRWYVEGNFSGDKKATALAAIRGRGREVAAEALLPPEALKVLGVSVDQMLDYVAVAKLGAARAGQIGSQAHFANGLAALYLATGQDVACVAESAVGISRYEARTGGLYCSVSLPAAMVGTVGGGTGLPAQGAWLELMGLRGPGKAAAFAEVAAALCLCGEISIAAAMASGRFARAHRMLARLR